MTYEEIYMRSDNSYLALTRSDLMIKHQKCHTDVEFKDGPIKIIMRLQNLQYKISKITAVLPI